MSQIGYLSGDLSITGALALNGALNVTGGITGQTRAGISSDTSQAYELPLTDWRIWDDYSIVLPDTASTAGLIVASLRYDASIADTVFFVANRDYRVVGITGRVEVAGTDGSAVTGIVKKAASATAITSGTALHSSTFNVKGTAATNQVLTLSTTATDLNLVAGNAIGFDLTGTPTSAVGAISVFLIPISPDDLAITSGAFATGLPYINTGNVKSYGTITRYARTMFTLPPEYVAAAAASLRFASGMVTTVADTSATILAAVYKSGRTTLISGSNLITTSAQSINSLTFAELSFALTNSGLIPGDVLDIRVAIAVNDAGGSAAVIGAIAHAEALLTVKG